MASLLVIVGEPFDEENKSLIVQQIVKGFQCWDAETAGCDVNEELQVFALKDIAGEKSDSGELVLSHKSDHLTVEVILQAGMKAAKQGIKDLLMAASHYKYIVFSGFVFQGSGAWILSDGAFAIDDFAGVIADAEVAKALQQQQDAVVSVNSVREGDWSNAGAARNGLTKKLNLSVNSDAASLPAASPGVAAAAATAGDRLQVAPLVELLAASSVVGSVRFSRPCVYVFPGGDGDAALFGVAGFTMLVDGGFSRDACFWNFARHLDRVDAVLATRAAPDNVFGLRAAFRRKAEAAEGGEGIYPHVGCLFANAPEKRAVPEPRGDLIVSVAAEVARTLEFARRAGVLRPMPTARAAATAEPTRLYHKVGHGTLHMYVLNPVRDSRELRDYLAHWGSEKKGRAATADAASIAALLVWLPASPDDSITRILFPGVCPQEKLFDGLDRLKGLDFLQHAECTENSLRAAGRGKGGAAAGVKGGVAGRAPPARPSSSASGRSARSSGVANGAASATAAAGKRTPPSPKKKPLSSSFTAATASPKRSTPTTPTTPKGGARAGRTEVGSPGKKAGGGGGARSGEVSPRKAKKTSPVEERAGKPSPIKEAGKTTPIEGAGKTTPVEDDIGKTTPDEDHIGKPSPVEDNIGKTSPVDDEIMKTTPVEDNIEDEIGKTIPVEGTGMTTPVENDVMKTVAVAVEPAAARAGGGDAVLSPDQANYDAMEAAILGSDEPMGVPAPGPAARTSAARKDAERSPAKAAARSGAATSSTKSSSVKSDSSLRRQASPPKRPTSLHKAAAPPPASSRRAAPSKPVVPVYVDLAYVPARGGGDVDFFRRVRARYYVLSCRSPSMEMLGRLLEGKATPATVVPTYDDVEALGYWLALRADEMSRLSVELAPAAARCTVNLQDHETSCRAFRLEF
ncbi:PREDICTED: microtubule-associated protein futsch-like [Priapulus caudatus]|uniref:Microtubule-associated protein futsch-like n=1 Tax=Priapulus caudatus TaxID=37621 RepID=A0ABM1EDI5_PRICU|nr:PREDICTED: microtubule-associated protein futsch-like [Priapulus caudatus]